ncbi:MAG: LuxR C-terminal-related transcriptional regulator [Pseudomonadota bacterium]
MVKIGLVSGGAFGHVRRVKKSIIIYALALAALAFVLQWIEYQYLTRAFTTEFYILLIGIGFTALGLWLGRMLTSAPRTPEFTLNEAALKSLGITKREHAVLEQMAGGQSNKEIAESLHVSPNTVKTHVSRLYEKLEVKQRLQAVQKARELQLIP